MELCTANDLQMDPLAWKLSFGLVVIITLFKDVQVPSLVPSLSLQGYCERSCAPESHYRRQPEANRQYGPPRPQP